MSASCIKPVGFIKSHHVCEYLIWRKIDICWLIADKKPWQPTCVKPVNNLQQTCYHEAGASNANASWYRLDNCKVIHLQQKTWQSGVGDGIAIYILTYPISYPLHFNPASTVDSPWVNILLLHGQIFFDEFHVFCQWPSKLGIFLNNRICQNKYAKNSWMLTRRKCGLVEQNLVV